MTVNERIRERIFVLVRPIYRIEKLDRRDIVSLNENVVEIFIDAVVRIVCVARMVELWRFVSRCGNSK